MQTIEDPQIDGNKLLKAAGYPTKDPLTLTYIISIRGILEDEEIEKLLELEEKYDDSIEVGYADAQAKITETNLENRTARGKLLGQLMTTLWAEREVILLKELLAGEDYIDFYMYSRNSYEMLRRNFFVLLHRALSHNRIKNSTLCIERSMCPSNSSEWMR